MQEVEGRLNAVMQAHPECISQDGDWGVNYSIQCNARKSLAVYQMAILLCSAVETKRLKTVSISTGTNDESLAKSLIERVEGLLELKGASKEHNLWTERNFRTTLDCMLNVLGRDKPNLYLNKAGIFQGVFIVGRQLVSPPDNHSIKVRFRPVGHIESGRRNEYIGTPDIFNITSNTRDPAILDGLIGLAKKHLVVRGLEERKVEKKTGESSIIPKNWIIIEEVKVTGYNLSKNYQIAIVRENFKGSIPVIRMSSGTSEREKADLIVDLLKTDYLPKRLGSEEPITIDGILSYLKDNGIEPDPKKTKERGITDRRLIFNPNGVIKAQLYSPDFTEYGTRKEKRRYAVGVVVAPSPDLSFVSQRGSPRLSLPLSANNRQMAIEQAILVYDIVESVLTKYYIDHPDAQFLTYLENIGKKQLRKIQRQPDPSYSTEVLAKEIYAALTVTDYKSSNPLVTHIKEEIDKAGTGVGIDIPQITEALMHELNNVRSNAVVENRSQLSQAIASGYASFSSAFPQYILWTDGDKILGIRPDTVNFIDARTLREDILQRPIDFARDLMWKVEIAPCDENDKEGKQHIKLQAVRDFCEGLNLLGSNNAIWNDPIEQIFADTPEAAKRFKETVISVLLTGQSRYLNQAPDPSISVDRPVDHFGEPSTQLVLRESLRSGLQIPGIDIPAVSYTLNAIKSGRSMV